MSSLGAGAISELPLSTIKWSGDTLSPVTMAHVAISDAVRYAVAVSDAARYVVTVSDEGDPDG